MRYDDSWVPPWRTTLKTSCSSGEDCHLLPPHLVMACTVDDAGRCRECSVRRGGIRSGQSEAPEAPVQLSLDGVSGA